MQNPRFDVVEYIRKLRTAGASQELAEAQAQEMEHLIGDILQQTKQESKELFESKELTTKGDLERVSWNYKKKSHILSMTH